MSEILFEEAYYDESSVTFSMPSGDERDTNKIKSGGF